MFLPRTLPAMLATSATSTFKLESHEPESRQYIQI